MIQFWCVVGTRATDTAVEVHIIPSNPFFLFIFVRFPHSYLEIPFPQRLPTYTYVIHVGHVRWFKYYWGLTGLWLQFPVSFGNKWGNRVTAAVFWLEKNNRGFSSWSFLPVCQALGLWRWWPYLVFVYPFLWKRGRNLPVTFPTTSNYEVWSTVMAREFYTYSYHSTDA